MPSIRPFFGPSGARDFKSGARDFSKKVGGARDFKSGARDFKMGARHFCKNHPSDHTFYEFLYNPTCGVANLKYTKSFTGMSFIIKIGLLV